MTKDECSIFANSRKKVGLTQERASELLNVSVKQLHRYENGETPVPTDILLKMAEIYKEYYILWEYLYKVGQGILPPIRRLRRHDDQVGALEIVAKTSGYLKEVYEDVSYQESSKVITTLTSEVLSLYAAMSVAGTTD